MEIITELFYITIRHSPIPKYSFSYENTKVKCCECGTEIMTDDLKTDDDDYCNYYYSDRVCPVCGEIDCCNLEYEKL